MRVLVFFAVKLAGSGFKLLLYLFFKASYLYSVYGGILSVEVGVHLFCQAKEFAVKLSLRPSLHLLAVLVTRVGVLPADVAAKRLGVFESLPALIAYVRIRR